MKPSPSKATLTRSRLCDSLPLNASEASDAAGPVVSAAMLGSGCGAGAVGVGEGSDTGRLGAPPRRPTGVGGGAVAVGSGIIVGGTVVATGSGVAVGVGVGPGSFGTYR